MFIFQTCLNHGLTNSYVAPNLKSILKLRKIKFKFKHLFILLHQIFKLQFKLCLVLTLNLHLRRFNFKTLKSSFWTSLNGH